MKAKLTKIKLPPPPPDEVTLTLSQEEAELLKRFVGQVTGPSKLYTLFGDIYLALNEIGIKAAKHNFIVSSDSGRANSFMIKDYKK